MLSQDLIIATTHFGRRPSSRVPAARLATASNASCAPPSMDFVTLDEVVKINIQG